MSDDNETGDGETGNAADQQEISQQSESAVVIPFQPADEEPLSDDQRHNLRIVEAILFASSEPITAIAIQNRLPDGTDVAALLNELQRQFKGRGVSLVQVAGGWAFRTADDLSFLLQREAKETRKLSRAALETLAIIAYHQPVTRAEIEEVRGVSISKGTLDVLMETGWIRMRGRRRAPGRPVTYGSTSAFLDHFMLDGVQDLPGLDEIKGAGLLDSAMPSSFQIPLPNDDDALQDDEDPLEDDDDLLMMADLIAEDEKA